MNPSNDGITHINIYSKAQTELGRFLSNFADCYVVIDDGMFRTIEGYWYWLSCKDDRLRHTSGWESKKLGRELRVPDWPSDPDFEKKILNAIAVKILSNEPMQKALKESTLPFYHYYVYNDKVIQVKEGLWMISFIEHLRGELKATDDHV